MQFVHRHVLVTLVVIYEGNQTLPRYPKCDMFVPCSELNWKHQAMAMSAKGVEHNLNWLREEGSHASTAEDFQDYGRPLETVLIFKYLRRFLTTSDDN